MSSKHSKHSAKPTGAPSKRRLLHDGDWKSRLGFYFPFVAIIALVPVCLWLGWITIAVVFALASLATSLRYHTGSILLAMVFWSSLELILAVVRGYSIGQ